MLLNDEEFFTRFGRELTEPQKDAVRSVDGAVLLLAVPGSGKTTVLTARVGYMILVRGIPPENILTMTYTVAAARDMSERFASVFGGEYASRLQFRTINGLCQSVINRYSNTLSQKEQFALISDEKVTARILTDLYRQHTDEYPAETDIRDMRTKIAYMKNMMLPENEAKRFDESGLPFSKIYAGYNAVLRKERLMDYDDQLVYARNILLKYPSLLEYYRERFPYICVDEAQDTSKIQHSILAMLAGSRPDLFMVGDEDQSIYGFRAAYPEALLTFEKTYPGAKILFIEDNFRSDANIVRLADAFIRLNGGRRDKNLKAFRPAVNEVREIRLASPKMQYDHLLGALKDPEGITAVLYRDNETAVPLIDLLDRAGIPFNIRNGDLLFFSSRTVRDIKDILRFAFCPDDTEAFLRVYTRLGLFIRKDAVADAAETARKTGESVLTVLSRSDLPRYTQMKITELKKHFPCLKRESPCAALARIIERMGYGENAVHTPETRRLDILEMLAKNTRDADSFLLRLEELEALIRDKTYIPDCPVRLSTVHSAKGLEYDVVYFADVYDGVLPENIPAPRSRDKEEKARYEEERRLFYVGVTRAVKKLYIFSFSTRTSVFTREFFRAARKTAAPRSSLPVISPDRLPSVGQTVEHVSFGKGTVTSVSANGETVGITFGGRPEKKFSLAVLLEKRLLRG